MKGNRKSQINERLSISRDRRRRRFGSRRTSRKSRQWFRRRRPRKLIHFPSAAAAACHRRWNVSFGRNFRSGDSSVPPPASKSFPSLWRSSPVTPHSPPLRRTTLARPGSRVPPTPRPVPRSRFSRVRFVSLAAKVRIQNANVLDLILTARKRGLVRRAGREEGVCETRPTTVSRAATSI